MVSIRLWNPSGGTTLATLQQGLPSDLLRYWDSRSCAPPGGRCDTSIDPSNGSSSRRKPSGRTRRVGNGDAKTRKGGFRAGPGDPVALCLPHEFWKGVHVFPRSATLRARRHEMCLNSIADQIGSLGLLYPVCKVAVTVSRRAVRDINPWVSCLVRTLNRLATAYHHQA